MHPFWIKSGVLKIKFFLDVTLFQWVCYSQHLKGSFCLQRSATTYPVTVQNTRKTEYSAIPLQDLKPCEECTGSQQTVESTLYVGKTKNSQNVFFSGSTKGGTCLFFIILGCGCTKHKAASYTIGSRSW